MEEEKEIKETSKKKKRTVRKKTVVSKKQIKNRNIDIEMTQDSESKASNFSLIEVIIIIIITGLVVSVGSGLIVYNNYDKFSKTRSTVGTDMKEFVESYNHILNSYVKDVDKGKLLDAAIKGMYDYLNDEHSVYLNEEETETMEERLQGVYEGVGIEITMNELNEIYITRIFKGTPAEKVGLKPNDVIISLDGESYIGKTTNDLSSTIKGSKKTTFEIGYRRDNKEYTVNVKRELVYIDSVSSKEYDNIGYLKIETFSATTAEQIKKEIKKFSNKIDSLIIDVRDNTGGYLNSAYDVLNLFVGKNNIVYQLKDREGNIKKVKATSEPVKKFKNITVLINGITASSSEILTGALKDNLNAKLVGNNTYGKGTVQEKEQLSSGAMVKYTTAYWLTPKGNNIDKIGIAPDYFINDEVSTSEDEQLLKAIEITK